MSFQDEESLGQEEVEAAGLEEDLDAVGLEDTFDSGGQDSEEEDEEEEGHEEGAGLYDKGVGGDRSASGFTSSHQLRSGHLICPPIAPHDDNRVVIVLCDDGSWINYSFKGDSRQRLANQVLGNLVYLHHPGVVTLLGNGHRELATTWEHYRFAPDGEYGTAQGAVAHDFWLHFQLPKEGNHQTHKLEVFNHTTHKVVKDTVSYARIEATNTYYKDVPGLEMNKKW